MRRISKIKKILLTITDIVCLFFSWLIYIPISLIGRRYKVSFLSKLGRLQIRVKIQYSDIFKIDDCLEKENDLEFEMHLNRYIPIYLEALFSSLKSIKIFVDDMRYKEYKQKYLGDSDWSKSYNDMWENGYDLVYININYRYILRIIRILLQLNNFGSKRTKLICDHAITGRNDRINQLLNILPSSFKYNFDKSIDLRHTEYDREVTYLHGDKSIQYRFYFGDLLHSDSRIDTYGYEYEYVKDKLVFECVRHLLIKKDEKMFRLTSIAVPFSPFGNADVLDIEFFRDAKENIELVNETLSFIEQNFVNVIDAMLEIDPFDGEESLYYSLKEKYDVRHYEFESDSMSINESDFCSLKTLLNGVTLLEYHKDDYVYYRIGGALRRHAHKKVYKLFDRFSSVITNTSKLSRIYTVISNKMEKQFEFAIPTLETLATMLYNRIDRFE